MYKHIKQNRTAGPTSAKKARERNMLVLDHMPLACTIWGEGLKIIDCNKAALELFQAESKEQFIKNFFDFSPRIQPCGEYSLEKAVRCVRTAFSDGRYVMEWLHRRQNGKLIPTEVTLVRVAGSKGYKVIGYTRDLFEQRRLLRSMDRESAMLKVSDRVKSESIAALETILNNMDAYVYVTVPDTGEILYVNNRLMQAFGLAESVVGDRCYKVFRGYNDMCEFCECNKHAHDSREVINWNEFLPGFGYIRHSDCYIDWPGRDQKVHLRFAVDITEAAQPRETAVLGNLTYKTARHTQQKDALNIFQCV